MRKFGREDWNIGVIHQSAADVVRNGITEPVRWLPQGGLADPACYTLPDGSHVLFAERPNWWSLRGDILTAHVLAEGDLALAEFLPWAHAQYHLSYPFPVELGNDLYLTMETAEAGYLYLWHYHSSKWMQTIILEGPVIDPTFWYDDNLWWLFCTFLNNESEKHLHLYFSDRIEGPWHPHPHNPVKTDLSSARSAGPLFRADDRLIRPSQDCTKTYGGALVLNEIKVLTPKEFREQPVRILTPQKDYPDGLHTLCPVGDSVIIDGKRWTFRPIDPLRYVVAGMRRVHRRRFKRQHVTMHFGPTTWGVPSLEARGSSGGKPVLGSRG
jgi:hypothetical protein